MEEFARDRVGVKEGAGVGVTVGADVGVSDGTAVGVGSGVHVGVDAANSPAQPAAESAKKISEVKLSKELPRVLLIAITLQKLVRWNYIIL